MTFALGSRLTDSARIDTLHASGLMDSPPEESFDRLAGLVARLVHAPTALITLLDAERQYIKSGVGLKAPWSPGQSVPIADSFCRHVVESGSPFLVTDARKDEHVCRSPAIQELDIISYVGVPLTVGGDNVLGSLCAIDHLPRAWVADELRILTELAAVAADQIELRIARQRAAEDALRHGEQRTRLVLDMAHDAFVAMNADGLITDWNPQAEATFGWRRDEVIGRPLAETIIPPAFRRAHAAGLRRFLATGDSTSVNRRLEMIALNRVGQEFPVELTISPVRVGDSYMFTCFLHDISQRKQAEEALRRSEERFQLAARATNDVIWEWDLVSGAMHWCPDAHKTFRYAPAEMGTSIEWWYERIHQEDRERVIGSLQQAIDGVGDFWSEEYRFLRGDGSYATVLDRAYVARDERKVPQRMIGSMVDVTERRRSEDAQRLLARASAALDSSLDCNEILAGLTRVVVPAFADLCVVHIAEEGGTLRRLAAAYAHPEKGTLRHEDEHFPKDADVLPEAFLGKLGKGKPMLVRRNGADGERRFGANGADLQPAMVRAGLRSLAAVPLVSHDRVLGAITLATAASGRQYTPVDLVVAEDLARRAAVALENCLLYARSEQAVRARDAVLGVVSHDLRNPLNTIHMAASMLLDGNEDRRAGNVRGLEIIQRSVQQMNRMIRDLLDASSIDAGRFRVAQSYTDVAGLLCQASDLLGPLAAAKKVHLECSGANGLPNAWVDADQMLRVFSNLIGNAIKFTSEGGTIRLGAEQVGDSIVFAVRDTGSGIPAAQLPHVFDRYWQGTRGDRRGAGLGLAIAKGIVEAHGGRIWVESTPGIGSTFSFSIPSEQRDAALTDAQLAAAS